MGMLARERDCSEATTLGGDGIAYSRHELLADWHSYARKVSPIDIRWHGKDQIEANFLLVRSDGDIEQPKEKLNKQAVIEQFGLLPRDLRSLDAHILDVRPALVVCQGSLILCTSVLRAIIAHDVLVLIGTDKDNPICDEAQSLEMAEAVQKVMKYLELSGSATGQSNVAPFELRALEALLLLTVRGIKNVVTELQERVYRTIPQLRFGVSPAELRDLLECKRTVEDCLMSGRAMQSALSSVLGDDEDLANMYLTDKAKGSKHAVNDHQQAELLLEYYYTDTDVYAGADERRLDETSESCERLSTLLSEVDSNISLVLASTRVRLQNLELQTAIGTLALAAGATIAGFFGMNLTSGLEEHPSAFYWAVGTMSSVMVGITAICWVRLMRARRSQLFLRSARDSRARAERWRAGPAGAGAGAEAAQGRKTDVRDVDVHRAVEEATGQSVGVSEQELLQDRAAARKGSRDDDPLHAKDGSAL
ncbi:magnesium ion transporter [Rhodotorula kratochvilovae]